MKPPSSYPTRTHIHLFRSAFALVALLVLAGSFTASAANAGRVVAWGAGKEIKRDSNYQNYQRGQSIVPIGAMEDVVAISGGESHSVALRADGSVVAWGAGELPWNVRPVRTVHEYGQSYVSARAQSGIVAIAAGVHHTLALTATGSVIAWGGGTSFSLQEPQFGQSIVPAAAESGVVAIAAGYSHSLALKNNGSVISWGYSYDGAHIVPTNALTGVVAIGAGDGHSVALKSNGSVIAWGAISNVPSTAMNGVVAIATGTSHILALKTNGLVVAWGENGFGQASVPSAARSGVMAISAGYSHSVALKTNGVVIMWGGNFLNYGQTNVPPEIQGSVGAISAGGYHTLAIQVPTAPTIVQEPRSQTVRFGQNAAFAVGARGYPLNYQWQKDGTDIPGATGRSLPLGSAEPEDSGSYTVVISNSEGSVTSVPAVLTVEPQAPGSVAVWGAGSTVVPIEAQSGVKAVAAGQNTKLALTSAGAVVAWGSIPGITNLPSEVRSGIKAIAMGEFHALALRDDGSLVAWGSNTNAGRNFPALAGHGVVSIAAGQYHSLALRQDGSIIAWGAGTNSTVSSPHYGQSQVPAGASNGIVAIAAGNYHSLALRADGSVEAWGAGVSSSATFPYYGQSSPPTLAQSGVMAIAAGALHSVALRTNGQVVAWGYNNFGQTNVPVNARSGVIAIAAAARHTLALRSDGTLVAWGSNGSGQTTIPPSVQSKAWAISAAGDYSMALIPVPAPALRLRKELSGYSLLWPMSPAGFTVERSSALHAPGWERLEGTVLEENSTNVLAVPADADSQFFRLIKP